MSIPFSEIFRPKEFFPSNFIFLLKIQNHTCTMGILDSQSLSAFRSRGTVSAEVRCLVYSRRRVGTIQFFHSRDNCKCPLPSRPPPGWASHPRTTPSVPAESFPGGAMPFLPRSANNSSFSCHPSPMPKNGRGNIIPRPVVNFAASEAKRSFAPKFFCLLFFSRKVG